MVFPCVFRRKHEEAFCERYPEETSRALFVSVRFLALKILLYAKSNNIYNRKGTCSKTFAERCLQKDVYRMDAFER